MNYVDLDVRVVRRFPGYNNVGWFADKELGQTKFRVIEQWDNWNRDNRGPYMMHIKRVNADGSLSRHTRVVFSKMVAPESVFSLGVKDFL